MGYKIAKLPGSWVYDLPLIGDHAAKIGRIQALYAAPCSPTPIMWVKGFFQAIPTLAITLKKPELIDINIAHRRGKPRKGKKFKFNADFILRDAIIEIPVPRWVPFQIWELGQRIGYYFLVADATETFALNWMSTAYIYNGCSLPNFTYMRGHVERTLMISSAAAIGQPMPPGTGSESRINIGIYHFQLIFAGQYQVTWTATFEPYEVESQATVPYATVLADMTGVTGVEIGEGGAAENGRVVASGSTIINFDGVSSPQFSFNALFAQAGKFCYVTADYTVDLVDEHSIGPDP